MIDKNLSWKNISSRYPDSLKLNISSALMAMKQVSFLPREPLTTLYHSLVESWLHYSNTVRGYGVTAAPVLKINYNVSKIELPEL